MRILYLEDEPADAKLVERYAQLSHHQTVIVNSVEQARNKLGDPPDLILVDILLNKQRGGYEFASELRAQGFEQPIIAVTGLALPLDIEKCYQAGFTDVLTKPYTVQQLADVFKRYGS